MTTETVENGRSPASAGSGAQASPEEWRDVVGYEGLYEVSSLGRVRSRYAINGHCLSTAGTAKDGYPVVSLSAPDGRHTYTVHRLVATAFHGDSRNALHREVAHLDGSRTNNRADNLKWVSPRENTFQKRAHGTHQAGERHPRAKLSAADVAAIRSRPLTDRRTVLATEFGVAASTIDDVRNRKTWRHV